MQVAPEASGDLTVGYSWDGREGEESMLRPGFRHDKFLLRQKIMTVGSRYLVWDEEQRPLMFVERPLHFWRQALGASAAVLAAIAVAFVGVMISINLLSVAERTKPGGP